MVHFPHRIEPLFSLQYLCKLLVRSISSPTNAATLDSTGSGPDAKRREYVPPATCAIVHGQLGEKDQAFEWLGKAYEARLPSLAFIAVDEALDPLRDDPRFTDLLPETEKGREFDLTIYYFCPPNKKGILASLFLSIVPLNDLAVLLRDLYEWNACF